MKKLFALVAVFGVATLVSASAFAVSPLRSVGVEAGYVSPDLEGAEIDGTWVAGVFMDFGMPMTNLYINPFVNYWNWSEGSGSAETSFRDWTIGANMKWTIPTASVKFQPFVAGGVAAHMLNVSSGSFDEGETKFGFQAGTGFNLGISQRTNIVGSGWYHIVEDVNQWSLRAGLAWTI